MSAGAGTVTLERPATLTLGNGTVLTSNMTPEQRSAAIRGSMGLPAVPRPTAEPFGPPGPTAYRDQQVATREGAGAIAQAPQPVEEVNRWFRQLPADKRDSMRGEYHARLVAAIDGQPLAKANPDGTVSVAAHAGLVVPDPQELERGNSGDKLAEFDREMREKGAQLPLGEPTDEELGRYDVDGHTGVTVDTWAIENYQRLFRERMSDPKISDADKTRFREEYREGLNELCAGYTDEDSGESETAQPRDAQGRYYTPSPHTPEQWEQGHASVTDANGFMPLERINKDGLSGYTLPRLVSDQTYHKGIFADLAWARANGVTQKQVDAFIADGMRRQGLIR